MMTKLILPFGTQPIPIVYSWMRGEQHLYVGSSNHGLERPYSRDHGINTHPRGEHDELVVTFCDDIFIAKSIEEEIIRAYAPIYNERGVMVDVESRIFYYLRYLDRMKNVPSKSIKQ